MTTSEERYKRVERIVLDLEAKPLAELSHAEECLLKLVEFCGHCGGDGIEAACESYRGDWHLLAEAITLFDLRRYSFLLRGPDWILARTDNERDKMTRLGGGNHGYFDRCILRNVEKLSHG